ncbi:uncharacterized protein [Aegilops tauschii subsp. strangulata]|uniref:uncharacterized protein n=1 Tax=Aegilops tauschii subsp. strangulata TaxID=200361 RepID=UPI003CC8A1D5
MGFRDLALFNQAMLVWDEIKAAFGIKLFRSSFSSPKQWLFDLLAHGSDRDISIITVALWHIWEARNSARNEPVAPPLKRTAARARAYSEMILLHLFKSGCAAPSVSPASSSGWSPPPPGTLLLSSDAVVVVERNLSAVGVVVQDHTGQCVAAASEPLPGVSSPELAEALAVRRAVLLAHQENYSHVVIHYDCLLVIQRLRSSAQDRSMVGSIISDIKTDG